MLSRLLVAIIALPVSLSAQSPARDLTPLVNHVFARWDSTTGPGCAVGIDRAGAPRFTRAFGAADLEYDIPNKPETIFEAGSISKQFTAAATVLLALDGKLNLEDDVRKYVPELPTYERPITIRHLLNHTSGLRDWGEIAALAGWPRETRVHTHDDVLDILHRQRALNYPPGDRYSYTNSGYNLLAIIVSRVSGQPFATFSRERLFKPLGLTSTQWRDDFRRVVKGSAQAYSRTSGGQWAARDAVRERPRQRRAAHYRQRPAHVDGDARAPDAGLEADGGLPARARPPDERRHDRLRARPLRRATTAALHRVEHSGATAGYRADLLRFPGRGLAVAVLCNAATAAPSRYANQLVDSLLASALGPPSPRGLSARARIPPTWKPNADDLAAYAGTYYSPDVETDARGVGRERRAHAVPPARDARHAAPDVADTFAGFSDRVWFTRDASGRVNALHVAGGRAYDVVFERR